MNRDNLIQTSMRIAFKQPESESSAEMNASSNKRSIGDDVESLNNKRLKHEGPKESDGRLEGNTTCMERFIADSPKILHEQSGSSVKLIGAKANLAGSGCSSSIKKVVRDGNSIGSLSDNEHQVTSTKNGEDAVNLESGLMTFPEKLFSLLDGGLVDNVMWWLADGDAFCFIPNLFAEKVLDKHFQGTKFESFTRKLNRWGFKRVAGQKVPPNTVAYYHNSFHKDKPEQIKEMSGGKTKAPGPREKKSSTNVTSRPRSSSTRESFTEQTTKTSDEISLRSLTTTSGFPGASRSGNVTDHETDFASLMALRQSSTNRGDPSALLPAEQLLLARSKLDAVREASINAELPMRLLRDGNNNVASNMLYTSPLEMSGGLGISRGTELSDSLGSGRRVSDPATVSDPVISHLLAQRIGGTDVLSNTRSPIEVAARFLQSDSNRVDVPSMFTGGFNRGAMNFRPELSMAQRIAAIEGHGKNAVDSQHLAQRFASNQMNLNLSSQGGVMGSQRFLPQNIGEFSHPGNDVSFSRLLAARQMGSGHSDLLGPNLQHGLGSPSTIGLSDSGTRFPLHSGRSNDDELLRLYMMEQQIRRNRLDGQSQLNNAF